MKISNLKHLMLIAAFMGSTWASTVQALPSFAREIGKNCSYCHNAWPQLNKKGRSFKELGYRLPDRDLMSFKDIAEEGNIPVSAVIIARPYDKKDSNEDFNMRALHEVELFVAGAAGKHWSGLFELEAEDEAQNDFGFDVGVPVAALTYNYNQAVNVQFVWGEMMWSDPYGFIGNRFGLTRGSVAAFGKSFDGDDGTIASRRQNLVLTGRPIDQLFYSVGLSGQADSPKGSDSTDVSEGKDPSTIHARVAFDITPDIMVGGFIIEGQVAGTTCTGVDVPADIGCTAAGDVVPGRPNNVASDTDLEYQRYGVDAQADFGNSRVQLSFVSASSDGSAAETGTENDNNSIAVQAYHVYKSASGAPSWVPLIRYDTYESSDGAIETDELTLNVTYYFEQNIKGYVEYWDRSAQNSANDDDRLTVQLAVGF